MTDKSCCSCGHSRYEVNETDDGNYITCSLGFDITEQMIEVHCDKYVRKFIHGKIEEE